MIRAARSYLTALRASARFGHASRLATQGRKEQALREGRAVLELLAKPHIVRTNPGEGSLLLNTTMLVEHLAYDLNQPGAGERDLSDALSFIRVIGPTPDLAPWIPYLEARLNQSGEASI